MLLLGLLFLGLLLLGLLLLGLLLLAVLLVTVLPAVLHLAVLLRVVGWMQLPDKTPTHTAIQALLDRSALTGSTASPNGPS